MKNVKGNWKNLGVLITYAADGGCDWTSYQIPTGRTCRYGGHNVYCHNGKEYVEVGIAYQNRAE